VEDGLRKQKYLVQLKEEERQQLKEIVSKGQAKAYQIQHANILLAVDNNGPACIDMDIAQALDIDINTVGRVRQRFFEQGLTAALERKKQDYPSRRPIFDGAAEAHLMAVACSQPPEGCSHWTLKLLADKIVELEIVEDVSSETIRRTLKKTNLSLI
jgi:uncharacterized protein YcgI (DUF1989 family)